MFASELKPESNLFSETNELVLEIANNIKNEEDIFSVVIE
jgi:hypothetical protein